MLSVKESSKIPPPANPIVNPFDVLPPDHCSSSYIHNIQCLLMKSKLLLNLMQ